MLAWLQILLLVTPAADAPAIAHQTVASAPTEDRLSHARMEALVAYPIALVRRGEIDAGEAAFEKLLRFRAAKQDVSDSDQGDVLTAFAILLYTHFEADDPDSNGGRAVPYLRRAVEAYRGAFGSSHLETALALNSYADALIETSKEPPREAETLLREALAIRTETLGIAHPETVAALTRLADIRTRRGRIRDDPEEGAALLRQLLEVVPAAEVYGALSDPMAVRARLAEVYIANGRIGEALEVVEGAVQRGHGLCGSPDPFGLLPSKSLPEEVARLLDEAGHGKQARLLLTRHPSVCGGARGR